MSVRDGQVPTGPPPVVLVAETVFMHRTTIKVGLFDIGAWAIDLDGPTQMADYRARVGVVMDDITARQVAHRLAASSTQPTEAVLLPAADVALLVQAADPNAGPVPMRTLHGVLERARGALTAQRNSPLEKGSLWL